jgi:hypothetical protein
MFYGMTAIKHTDPDKVLDAASKYYAKYNLSLAEVVVGNGESKYVKKRYKNLDEFREEEQHTYIREFNNHFDFYFNLKDSKDWVVFMYDSYNYPAKSSININRELASFLSSSLKTEVIEYYNVRSATFEHIRKYSNGKKVDEASVEDNIVSAYGEGYFKKFDLKYFGTATKVFKDVLSPYYERVKFNPESDELDYYYEKSWRHFYLRGSLADVSGFLKHKQKSF